MAYLYDIVTSNRNPAALKIIHGTLMSEEGKQFGPGDQIMVYGGGIKTYVTPEDISLFQTAIGRELFETEYVNHTEADKMFSCLFVSHNVGFKDTHYSQKTYTRVSELLQDRPRYVKVNTSFLAYMGTQGMININEGEVLELLFDDIPDTFSQKDQRGRKIKAKLNGEIIVIQDSKRKLNVDSLFDEQVYDCNSVLSGRITLPRIMSFSNQEEFQMFDLATGYTKFVINNFKYAVCVSECPGKIPEQKTSNMSVVRGVYCVAEENMNLKEVRVEVLSTMENLTSTFAYDTGEDAEGFKLYDVYLNTEDQQKQEVQAPIPLLAKSQRDYKEVDLRCEDRLQGIKYTEKEKPPPPPIPPKPSSQSAVNKANINSRQRLRAFSETTQRYEQNLNPKDRKMKAVSLPSTRTAMAANDTRRFGKHFDRMSGTGTTSKEDEVFIEESYHESYGGRKRQTGRNQSCGTVKPIRITLSFPSDVSLLGSMSYDKKEIDLSVTIAVSVRQAAGLETTFEEFIPSVKPGSELEVELKTRYALSQESNSKMSLTKSAQGIKGKRLMSEEAGNPPSLRQRSHSTSIADEEYLNLYQNTSNHPGLSYEKTKQQTVTPNQRYQIVRNKQQKYPSSLSKDHSLMTADDTNRVRMYSKDLNPELEDESNLPCEFIEESEHDYDNTYVEPSTRGKETSTEKEKPPFKRCPSNDNERRYFIDVSGSPTAEKNRGEFDSEMGVEEEQLYEVIEEMKEMSVSKVVEYLNNKNFPKLARICKENIIDGAFLEAIPDEHLKNDPFNLSPFELLNFQRFRDGNIPKL